MFADPTDFFKVTTDYFKSFPKNPDELKDVLTKVKHVFETEKSNSTEMWKIYNKSLSGKASISEIMDANKKLQELLVATRFAFLLAVPGTLFVLPLLIKVADEHGIDLVPVSVKKEFKV